MKKPDNTGYDPQEETPEERTKVHFRLVQTDRHYSAHLTCSLLREGLPIGLIHLNSKEEFDWLEQRIRGDFEPQEEMRDD